MVGPNVSSIERKRLRKLLEAVFTVCALHETIGESELVHIVEKARVRGYKRAKSLSRNRHSAVDFDTLGLVIHRWQRSAKYLDEDGRPFPIPARGPEPSIEALFKEVRKARYFELGVKHLAQLKRVRRTRAGKFLPLDVTTIVTTLTPELFEVLALNIQRLVTTVLYNTSLKRSTSVRLIERSTVVPDLPKNQLIPFKKFAREQGAGLIATINEWLESHRGSGKSRSSGAANRVVAGVQVYGFVGGEK